MPSKRRQNTRSYIVKVVDSGTGIIAQSRCRATDKEAAYRAFADDGLTVVKVTPRWWFRLKKWLLRLTILAGVVGVSLAILLVLYVAIFGRR